ncbi:hypothetical protein SDC9_185807 [bioreactor metagenome]|uniref:Uncharacterized protein n=1 Tax=bioreactor metagenome TaxID=1076179 RepID=A0A645HSC1_9ZZZZ
MVRLFYYTFSLGIPLVNTKIQTFQDLRPQFFQPIRIAADPPVAVNLYNFAQLPIACGVESMFRIPDRNQYPELLMAG